MLMLGPLALFLVLALPAPAAEPYQMNAILSLSGSGSFLGKSESDGLLAIEGIVNKTGGIAGTPIKFVIADDQSSPQVAVQLTNGLIAKGVPLIIGSSLVAACSAMAGVAQNGPVIYCLSPGFHPAKGTYAFSYGISTADLIEVSIRYFRERGWKKLALITPTDASGQDGERSLDAVLALPENKSIAVVDREHFTPTDVSVAAQVSHAKASGVQAVVAWGTGTPLGTVLRSAFQAGVDLPMTVSSSNLNYEEMRQFGAFLPKELYIAGIPSVAPDSLPNGPLRAAATNYVDAFKAIGIRADASQAIAWDPGWILVGAFKKLGLAATASQIRDYILNLHGWYGAAGQYDFRDGSQRGVTGGSAIVVRWDPAQSRFVGVSKPGGVPVAQKQ